MFKILNIIGARPQIIKAAAISRAIKKLFSNQIEDVIVHTGQHYDKSMSDVFFEEMQIPKPTHNLNVGSASHGVQTAQMLKGIEELINLEKPNCVLLYGDTNSTLAGAIAAAKIHVPIAHIEAGLRSFNKKMPEEINRIVCDHSSTLLFSPTLTGMQNLEREGFNLNAQKPYTIDNPAVFHCGDVMYDNSLYYASFAEQKSNILSGNNLVPNQFILSTIHRDNNTDNPARLTAILDALNEISLSNNIKIVLPLHPRTSNIIKQSPEIYSKYLANKLICWLPPVTFFEMIVLEKNARLIMTDSGGVQKEAFFFDKPCLILRNESEWKELIECGSAIITDADTSKILNAFNHFSNQLNLQFPLIFGDGHAAEFICKQLIENIE